MFTGLVQTMGTIVLTEQVGSGRRLQIRGGDLPHATHVGDSIAVNGCCLTVVEIADDILTYEAGPETLGRTTCNQWKDFSFLFFVTVQLYKFCK